MGCCNIRMLSLFLGWLQIVSCAIAVIWFLVSICVYDHEMRTREAAMTTTPPTLLEEIETKLMPQSPTERSLLTVENNIEADAKLEKDVESGLHGTPTDKEGDSDAKSHESKKPSDEGSTPLNKDGESHESPQQPTDHSTSSSLDKVEESDNKEELDSISTTVSTLEDVIEPATLGLLITYFVLFVLFLVFAILLVLGILQERPKLMLPYIYMTSICIGLDVLCLIYEFIRDMVAGTDFGEVMLTLFYETLSLGLMILCLVPIYIQYKRMRLYFDQTERHSLRNTAPVPKPSYVHGDDV